MLADQVIYLLENGWQPFDACVDALAKYFGPPVDQWLYSMRTEGMSPGEPPPDYGPIP